MSHTADQCGNFLLTTKPLIGSAQLIAKVGRLIANRQQTPTTPYLHATNRKKEWRIERKKHTTTTIQTELGHFKNGSVTKTFLKMLIHISQLISSLKHTDLAFFSTRKSNLNSRSLVFWSRYPFLGCHGSLA